MNVFMRFDIKRFGGAARLDVATTYVGANAEGARAAHASSSQNEFKNQAASQILKVHPRALAGPARVEDREATNEVVVHQSFELDADDWIQTTDNRKGINLFPPWLFAQTPVVPADRKSPIAFAFPFRVTHRIEVHSPEELPVPRTKTEAPTPAFDLTVESMASGKEAVALSDYVVRARRLEPGQFKKYRSDLEKTTRALDLTFAEPRILAPASRATLFTALAAWSVVLLVALFCVQLREPHFSLSSVTYRPELAGRRGWLALLALGVTLSPVRAISTVGTSLSPYAADAWSAATNPASAAYHPAWEPLLTTYALVNATVIVAASYSVYLFWTGRRSFPLVYIVVLGLGIASILGDALVTSLFESWKPVDAQTALTQTTQGIAVPIAIAWIVYLFRSERVKATFLAPANPTATA